MTGYYSSIALLNNETYNHYNTIKKLASGDTVTITIKLTPTRFANTYWNECGTAENDAFFRFGYTRIDVPNNNVIDTSHQNNGAKITGANPHSHVDAKDIALTDLSKIQYGILKQLDPCVYTDVQMTVEDPPIWIQFGEENVMTVIYENRGNEDVENINIFLKRTNYTEGNTS